MNKPVGFIIFDIFFLVFATSTVFQYQYDLPVHKIQYIITNESMGLLLLQRVVYYHSGMDYNSFKNKIKRIKSR